MQTVTQVIGTLLAPSAPPTVIQSITAALPGGLPDSRVGELDVWSLQMLLASVDSSLRTFTGRTSKPLLDSLREQLVAGRAPRPTRVQLKISSDAEVLLAARETQRLSRPFFSISDVVRVTTAVSEFSRNIYMYAKEGSLSLTLAEEVNWLRLEIIASDVGPGIPDVDLVLSGSYVSRTGLGRGLAGSKALLDELQVSSAPGMGTTVRGVKRTRRQ